MARIETSRVLKQVGILILTALIVGALFQIVAYVLYAFAGSGSIGILFWQFAIIPTSTTISFIIGLILMIRKSFHLKMIVLLCFLLNVVSLLVVLFIIVLSGYEVPTI